MSSVTLQDVLRQFGVWEAEALRYKQLLTDAIERRAELEWGSMAEHIDRMTQARDGWLDLSQQYCEAKAQRSQDRVKPPPNRR